MSAPDPIRGPAARRDPFDLPQVTSLTIAVLGGTGEQGRGLAMRWQRAGLQVILGSRDAQRATAAAQAIGAGVHGAGNRDAAAAADIVVVAVPWSGHAALLRDLAEDLAGRIVVDCVNPLGFDRQGPYVLEVPEGSAAEQAAAILPRSRVVGAFHNVSAVLLQDLTQPQVPCDVLVLGDDREATDTVQALAGLIPGMRGLYGGRLRNCRQVEALTANLIAVNRRYRAHAGLRITDV